MKSKKLRRIYRQLSYSVFSAFILFIAINLLVYGYHKIRYSRIKNILRPYLKKEETHRLINSYGGIYTAQEIFQIQHEFCYLVNNLQYEPWVGFREQPYRGEYLNITEDGYRLNTKVNRKINGNKLTLFAFGGSTMLGYGVADNHTIAAYLEKEIDNSRVINYGRASYYSSQEMLLFLNLLKQDAIPDIAIFLDGVNDIRILSKGDVPAGADMLKKISSRGFYINRKHIPILRLINGIIDKMSKKSSSHRKPDIRGVDKRVIREKGSRILFTYAQNVELIKLIANKYNIKVYFFWLLPPSTLNDDVNKFIRNNLPKGVVDLTDVLEMKEMYYLDSDHCNPLGSSVVAREIAKFIKADIK